MKRCEEKSAKYAQLCEAAKIEPTQNKIDLAAFSSTTQMANYTFQERLTAALLVLVDMLAADEMPLQKIDRVLIDNYIVSLDQAIGRQLDEIMHHDDFQQSESLWRSLKYLVDSVDFSSNIKLEIMDVSKESLRDDFAESSDIVLSGLHNHLYVQEYDTPGGEPITAIISNYEFDSSSEDIKLLHNISKTAAAAHCPFIASVGADYFFKTSIEEVGTIEDLRSYMERAEYIPWNSFREQEDARYIGLTFPRFLLRLPYGEQNTVYNFCYDEQVAGETACRYLWGSAAFAFAANMARSFQQYGWTLNIRGPESGGKVENLPLHYYDIGFGMQPKIPTELLISETRELQLAELGLIPLSYYKNSDYSCFFSANSLQKPFEYSSAEATANSRINARLPYVLLTARLGHYLKVLQRENIGSNKNRVELEAELNAWLQSLVTTMNKPGPELAATHPLREGRVLVEEIDDNPGFYKILLQIMPHFQIEGVDVKLCLVGRLPRALN